MRILNGNMPSLIRYDRDPYSLQVMCCVFGTFQRCFERVWLVKPRVCGGVPGVLTFLGLGAS